MKKNIVLTHIRKNSFKHLLLYLLPLIIVIVIYCTVPFKDILNTKTVDSTEEAIALYEEGYKFVIIKPKVIYYTGYDMMIQDNSVGAYYYEITEDDKCNFLLLYEATDSVEKSYNYSGIFVKFGHADGLFDNMLRLFATDINWIYEDLKDTSSDIILQQADNERWLYQITYIVIILVFIFSVVKIITSLMYILIPILHPIIRKIKKYDKFETYKVLSEKLDEELSGEVVKAGGMYITNDYFIHLGSLYMSIVPLKEIVFVYKNSQLKNLRGMNFMLYYNVHVRGYKRFRCFCPGKRKEDADYILDAFASSHENIINGYSEENKQEAFRRIKEEKAKNKDNNKKKNKEKSDNQN